MACSLSQHIIEGHNVLRLENEILSVGIDMDRGAHLFELTDKRTGIDVLYKDPKGLAAYDVGGWYELFPNAGKACSFKGMDIPAHGDVHRLPWTYRIERDNDAGIVVSMQTESKARPFALERTISLASGKSVLRIAEKITNRGDEAEPYLWGHHVTFGAPFVSPFSRIDLPACHVYKRGEYDTDASRLAPNASGSPDDMPGRLGDRVDLTYFPKASCAEMLFIDGLRGHWYNVFNERDRLGFALAWDGDVFPFLWLWQEHHATRRAPFNGQVYGLALEPQSSNVPILANAAAAGQAPILQAGQSRETWLTAILHDKCERVTGVDREGEVIV